MLLCPVEIDLAGPHSLEGALHAERADVDVSNDNRDEENSDYGVYDLRDLHPRNIRHVERKQQEDAGNGNRRSRAKCKPEH